MSSTRTLRLDQIVDGAGATVEARVRPDGVVADARLAMDGMPRIEPYLLGRPVTDVPGIVERLCSICPVAHQLAGMRALEGLLGVSRLTPTADAVRRLLHHGAVLGTHAEHLVGVDPEAARALRAFGHAVVGAAGGDSHFPRCAVPGGVRAPLPVPRRDQLAAQGDRALESASRLVALLERDRLAEVRLPSYRGHDVALVDRAGALDLHGDRLRAVAADGSVTVGGATAGDWVDLVAESCPASPAPRPYLRTLGPGPGAYRVGPVAQLRAATRVTPLAESARQRWRDAEGGATWARAVVSLHVVEVVRELVERPELVTGPVLAETATGGPPPSRTASGWIDGARGLLVHTYRADDAGLLRAATVTTPTAQTEAWLADLLLASLRACSPTDSAGARSARLPGLLEAAVREADPCLPCTSLPAGRMAVRVRILPTDDMVDAARDTGEGSAPCA